MKQNRYFLVTVFVILEQGSFMTSQECEYLGFPPKMFIEAQLKEMYAKSGVVLGVNVVNVFEFASKEDFDSYTLGYNQPKSSLIL